MELERKKDQRGEKKNDPSKRETRAVGGHSCRKGSRVERYTNVMAPGSYAIHLLWRDSWGAAPRKHRCDCNIAAWLLVGGNKKIYMWPWTNSLVWMEQFCRLFHQPTSPQYSFVFSRSISCSSPETRRVAAVNLRKKKNLIQNWPAKVKLVQVQIWLFFAKKFKYKGVASALAQTQAVSQIARFRLQMRYTCHTHLLSSALKLTNYHFLVFHCHLLANECYSQLAC